MALEWGLPFETRSHEFETLARDRLVVRFDSRCAGLSDRRVADISLEARCRDIDAVVDRLGLERFALQGQLHSGSWAIAYAASHPERVTHLILVQAYPDGAAYWATPGRAALQPLARLDWTTYTEASMSQAFAWAPGDLPRALAAQMRASMSQEDFLALLEFEKTCDVTQLLPRVQCPVLVAHFELNTVTGPDVARKLASMVPNGRMCLPKSFHESLAAYTDFLDEGTRGEPAAAEDLPEGALRIYLVANATHRPGAVEFMIAQHGGLPVSSIAGTTTSLFASVAGAMGCARALAQAVSAGVGIHAGEPGQQPRDHADPALVTAVLAAGMARPGQVVVSNVVRELAAGKNYGFEQLESGAPGEDAEPIRLFALR
jgi:pimeloyl-ACP methyl ester carboxylesterase